MKSQTYGFGFQPTVSSHHFCVGIPRQAGADIIVKEIRNGAEYPRCILPRRHWEAIAFPLQASLNQRLQNLGLPLGHWHTGETQIERLLGKELCLLALAIEEAPIEQIAQALSTWGTLWDAERWWLYTETAAATGRALEDRGYGWRTLLHMWMTTPPQRKRVPPPADQAFFVARSGRNASLSIYEVVDSALQDRREEPALLRAEIPFEIWSALATPVATYFRHRLKAKGEADQSTAWRTWHDVLPRHLGRELALLAWELEEATREVYHSVFLNWSGFRPEERWQLYQWVQHDYESLPEGRGKRLRGGIRVMLQENLIDQTRPLAQHQEVIAI